VCVWVCNVWVCVCVGFVICGWFGNICTCFCCVLYFFVYLYLFLLVLSIPVYGLLPRSEISIVIIIIIIIIIIVIIIIVERGSPYPRFLQKLWKCQQLCVIMALLMMLFGERKLFLCCRLNIV